VERPRSLDEALAALEGASERARVLAGGTDLMVELESGRASPDLVVDVWRLDELRGIAREDGGWRLGALVTAAEILASDELRSGLEILVAAADTVGAEQIKNRATVGGNLGTASPAADLNPVLLAAGASVRLASAAGRRELALEDFFTGYRASARRPDELIESVLVPFRPPDERRAFRKVGTRAAQAISKVVVALCLRLDGDVCAGARAAAGSVADRTLLLPSLARELEGLRLDRELLDRAAWAAARDAAPIDDVRSTAAYRGAVLRRVLRRMLETTTGLQDESR
jgi:carbon-monoxide dehydrogenase medium subunit